MNVSLTPELVAYIEARVASGSFRSRSEVVRHALRALESKEPLAESSQRLGQEKERGTPTALPGLDWPTHDPALDAKIREEIEPLMKVRDGIREIVFAWQCLEPRIAVHRLGPVSDDLSPGRTGDGPSFLLELVVKSRGKIRLGVREEIETLIQQRFGFVMMVEYEGVWLKRPDAKDVAAVIPL